MSKRDLNSKYLFIGMLCSSFVHVLILFSFFINAFFTSEIKEDVVYSVTLESGNKKGGIEQIAKKTQKTSKKPAPPKKVKKEATKKKEVVKVEKKKETKKKEVKKTVKKEIKKKEVVKKTPKPKPKLVKEEKGPKVNLDTSKKKEVIEKPKEKEVEKIEKKEIAEEPIETTEELTLKDVIESQTKGQEEAKINKRKEELENINKNYEEALQKYLGNSTKAGGDGFGSSGQGGNGFGGGIVKSPEWFRYKRSLENAIRQGWNWHDNSSNLVATVSMKISPTGALSGIRLAKSSGNDMYDDSILRAVSKASPVPVAPSHIYPDFKHIEIDFRPE